MDITLFALSGAFIALSSGVMAFGMFTIGRTHLHILWGTFCLIVLTWGVGVFFVGSTPYPDVALMWWRVLHVDVAFMPVVFLHFVYVFINRRINITLYLCYAAAIAISALIIWTDLMVAHTRFVFGQFYYDSPPGSLYWIFMFFFLGLTVYNHVVLYQRLRDPATPALEKHRIQYFFLASAVGFAGASMCFFPVYQIDIYPITNFSVVVYPVMMGYAIFRFKLFDIRAAVAQGLVLLLWIFLGIRLALSTNATDLLLNGILLCTVLVLGFYLIRSINKELAQREVIETQEKELELVNQQQESLLHFISHEIKGYLTKGQNAFASIADEGGIPDGVKTLATGALGEMRKGTETVMNILDASNFKKGAVSFAKQPFDFKQAVQQCADELRPAAQEKGVSLVVSMAPTGACTVVGDEQKMRQHVIRNLIDNAIRYTPSGKIEASVSQSGSTVRLVVQDSGVGITPEDMGRLFTEGGHGKESIKVNVHSTGYGLFIAKSVVEAHGGKIWAESDGAGKGSRFIVELPISL